MAKERLDKLLVDLGLCESRQRAQALILAGQVVVGDHAVVKAGQLVDAGASVRIKGEVMPYVSRGGVKLAHALDVFGFDPAGLACLDVGASTGGFTDVLLQRGARTVCALDVGHNQLTWKLRQDPRVVSMEGVNVRHLDGAALPFAPEAMVCDVSFISLSMVLPRLVELARGGGWRLRFVVCLVKPQFEVGKGEVGKGGVVRDEQQRRDVVAKTVALAESLVESVGLFVVGVTESPITGPAGNVEYLLGLGQNAPKKPPEVESRIERD